MTMTIPRFAAVSLLKEPTIRQDGAVVLDVNTDNPADLIFPAIEGLRPSDLPGSPVKLTIRPERDTIHGQWPVYDVAYTTLSNRNPGMDLHVSHTNSFIPLHNSEQFGALRALLERFSLPQPVQDALGKILKAPSRRTLD